MFGSVFSWIAFGQEAHKCSAPYRPFCYCFYIVALSYNQIQPNQTQPKQLYTQYCMSAE